MSEREQVELFENVPYSQEASPKTLSGGNTVVPTYSPPPTDPEPKEIFSSVIPDPTPAAEDVPTPPGDVPRPEMKATALVFLENPLARQLAVAWEACEGNNARWLEAAGIEGGLFADAHRLCSALRINGICRDGGVTDPLALRYISTIVARPLLKGRPNDKSK